MISHDLKYWDSDQSISFSQVICYTSETAKNLLVSPQKHQLHKLNNTAREGDASIKAKMGFRSLSFLIRVDPDTHFHSQGAGSFS